jgi:hypothetical protein
MKRPDICPAFLFAHVINRSWMDPDSSANENGAVRKPRRHLFYFDQA